MSLSKFEVEPQIFSPERKKPKLKLVLDIDEVLVYSMNDGRKRLNEAFGTNITEEELIRCGHTTRVPEWQALGSKFNEFSEKLRASPEFVLGHPEVPGAKEGVEKLVNSGFEIKAYLTSRPEDVKEATEESLFSLMKLPFAPVIYRPKDFPYNGVTEWKAEVLARLSKEDEILMAIDDNPFLPSVLAEIAPEVKIVVLRMPHNENKISENGCLNAPWEEIPGLVEKLEEEL